MVLDSLSLLDQRLLDSLPEESPSYYKWNRPMSMGYSCMPRGDGNTPYGD